MEWKLFADLAEIAGQKRVAIDSDAETVGQALSALLDAHPGLGERVLDDDGEVRDHINILRNGQNVYREEGLDTPVDEGDELALFPPVSGG